MKKPNWYLYLSAAIFALASCSKNEMGINESAQKASTVAAVSHYAVNPPYDQGEAGVDPPIKLHVTHYSDSAGTNFPFKVIMSPTSAYKDETCLLDISKLENGKTYSIIQDSKLAVGFFYDYLYRSEF
jgi:hypothetical protein